MGPLSLFVLGALLLAEGGLGEKGAFERILEVNLGKDMPESKRHSESHLYEGDIRLSERQRLNNVLFGNPDGSPSRAATNVDKIKWPNAVIPYEFDCSVASIDRAVRTTMEAMAEWESKTCIRFVKRTTEKEYLWFHRGMGCWCEVGKVHRRATWLSIGHGCEYKHVMTHELGHAIGFWHEQSRPDRDNYLKIHWENILEGMAYNFKKKVQGTEVVDYGVPYDYSSIMHYPWTAFSKNGQMTMEPIRHLNGKTPYVRLSDDDALQARRMYQCSSKSLRNATAYTAPERCTDRANTADCESWRDSGFCTEHSSMIYHCKKTCGFCSNNGCMDKQFECKKWATEGKCSSDKANMDKECPHTCNVCKPCTTAPSETFCKDNTLTADCESWKSSGFCTAHDAMITHCKKTCGFCLSDACFDVKNDCKKRAAIYGECDKIIMEMECPYTCGYCDECTAPAPTDPPVIPTVPTTLPNRTGVGLICVDKRESCPAWAAQGDCKTNGYTEMACRISCGTRCDTYPIKPNGTCSEAFGLGWPGNYALPDSAFSASTEYRPDGYRASADNARLYFEDDQDNKRIGGWCANDRDNQWLQIDLGKIKKVRAIATQGRDVFHEHVKEYKLAFSNDGSNFQIYQENGQEKNFIGNCDHFTPVVNTFTPVTARYVKILVGKSSYPCMRVELYGCDA
ncbi:zinc metalloproteinase nas-15-like [Oculina patagonica]